MHALNTVVPTTELLNKYSPTYTCLFMGAQWFLENGGRDALGGNGKSVIMDAALLMGDDPYRYPDNLPRVNATGGPGGKPSCGSLPDISKNYPVKYLVTDTGFGTGLDIRPNPGIGFPGIANYFPVTKANPEPPRIRYPGGPAPGPRPAYPGAPPYGAPLYGPDGAPLYPPPPPGAPPAVEPGTPLPAPVTPTTAGGAAMRRNSRGVITRVLLFITMCLVFMFVLVTVFGQFRFDARNTYSAVFTNVSGLKGGNFVRIAGVEVGKVKNMSLHKDGTVTVEFSIDKGLTLTEGTKAAVRYENLIGDRYLSLEEGAGSVRKLQPGQTIPLERTSPALDVDALIGGFRPLFRALDPDQVNALSGELLRVFQGQGGTISSVLSQTSALTSTLAGRDQLIGEVIKNLNTVLGTFAKRDDQFSEGLDKLSQFAQGLADRRSDIASGTAYINAAAGSVADLLVAARQPIKDTVIQTDRVSGQIMADHEYVDNLLKTLPDAYQVLARQGLYGDYFGFYLCDAILKLNGKGGQPVFVKLVGQSTGRCAAK